MGLVKSTETVNVTLKQRIKNQECRTVTNDYLCDDCVLWVVKEWLEQKHKEIEQTKKDFPSGYVMFDHQLDLLKELIGELTV